MQGHCLVMCFKKGEGANGHRVHGLRTSGHGLATDV